MQEILKYDNMRNSLDSSIENRREKVEEIF